MNRSRRKPTSCSGVLGSLPSGSTHCATLLPFPLFLFFLPHFSSILCFPFLFFPPFLFSFHFLFFPPFLFSFPTPPSFSYELFVTSHLYKIPIPCKLTLGLPRVTHIACHVSYTWHAMCLVKTCIVTHGLPCVT